jgi:SAM-dependent methyltransferase
MSRFPNWLKRPLLPIWNGGHRLAGWLGEVADAVRHRRFERCAVCARGGPVLYRREVIPRRLEELWGITPRLAEAFARKESNHCAWCGAKLRARRLARALLDCYPVGSPPVPARSLAEWTRHADVRTLRIAEINRIEGLHEQLARLAGFSCSDFQPGVAPGTVVEGVRCEDLMGLTYPDASFDVVLTSETIEHVPNLATALGEIHRVLVPGGRHLFTVPLLPGVALTFPRAVIREDGTIENLVPMIRHPGGDVGYPVFTEFGADLPEILRRAGFEVDVAFGPVTEDDMAQVFVCRKAGSAATN